MRGINVIKRIFSTNIKPTNIFYPYEYKRHMFFDLNNPEVNNIDKNTLSVNKSKNNSKSNILLDNNTTLKKCRNKVEMHESHSAKPFIFKSKNNV
jgi:hypothetical protein